MRSIKLALAFAFFMSSATYESQVMTTKNGLDSSWTVTISANNEAFALANANEFSMNAF